MTWYEIAQGWIAAATLPVTLAFLVLFLRPSERWWSTWFGWSLGLLALGVFAYSSTTVLYRWLGDYPGRPALLILATTLVLVAMVIRTIVLYRSQRSDRHQPPHVGDPRAIIAAAQEFQAAVAKIEHLEPCPNPDCGHFRAELIRIARTMPTHTRF